MTESLTRDMRYVEVTDEYVRRARPESNTPFSRKVFRREGAVLSRGNSGREYKEVLRCVT